MSPAVGRCYVRPFPIPDFPSYIIGSLTHLSPMRIKPFLVSMLALVTSSSLAQSHHIDSHKMDENIVRLMELAGIPGLSIAVINQGQTEFYGTYGVKRAEAREPVDSQTLFEAASLTKPIVAYCALKLAEQNLLELDRPLHTYLEYKDAAHNDRYKTITARMVLSHTSGFPNWRSERKADKLNLKFKPGSKFGYSGEGFVYLQKVMEHILGLDLNIIANTYVFVPLNMTRSSLIFNHDENYAIGHDSQLIARDKSKPGTPNAAYSLHTTAGDYAKFLNELFEPHFIGRAWRDQMISVQSFMRAKDTALAWGLGIGLNLVDDNTYLWHWGDNGVFRAFFIASTDSGLGFVYFANSENGLGILDRLIELVYGEPEIMSTWKKYQQF